MTEPVYLRMSPPLRRSALYVMVASVPLMGIAFWVARFAQRDSLASAAARSSTLGLLGLAMIAPLRWTLRIDDRGIARRRLLGWDLWTWSELASGRIEKRYPCAMVDPERPWWRRSLSLEYLASGDLQRTLERVNQHYVLPGLDVPDRVEIKYRFRRLARLDGKGIELITGDRVRAYLWTDVRRVHITRFDPVSRHFKSLEITLPDEEIELTMVSHEGGTTPGWRGAAPEVVDEFLRRHVPAERIAIDQSDQTPAHRVDAQKALERMRKRARDVRGCLWIYLSLFAGTLIWMAVMESVLKALVMTLLLAIPTVPVYLFLRRDFRRRCLELETAISRLDGEQTR